uniref:TVP38/TMEM64 family membrane protein n=1 Tax=Panagrolaimus sp. PS1159 TaxID=55785 RepID=A0AC35FFZ6_9BILA
MSNKHQWILGLSIFSMLFLLGITIAWFTWAWQQIPGIPSASCWSVTCVAGFNGSAFSIWAKLVTGFMNSIIGIFFFFILNRFHKDLVQHGQKNADQANKRRANRLAFFTIVSELISNFFPAFIDLILRMSIDVFLTQYFGVYTLFLGAVDGTLVAIIYSKSFGTLKAVKSSIVRLT